MPGSAGPRQAGAQGAKPGGPPGGQAGKMSQMAQQMGGQDMPQMHQMPEGFGGPPPTAPPGAGGGQGGKPGGPPAAGAPGNPNDVPTGDMSAAVMPSGPGDRFGMPGMSTNDMINQRMNGPPQSQYTPEGAPPNPNRWGPGMSAGPGVPGPYQPIDANSYGSSRPEGFSSYLQEIADKGKIAPHERTAQSYGPSPEIRPQKGGK